MGVTVDQAVSRVLSNVEGRQRSPMERLNGVVTTTASTVTVEFGDRNIHNGTYLEIGNEILYVYDNGSAPALECLRAQAGTTAVQHADNSLVKIEPRVERQTIQDRIKDVIADLPDTIWSVTTTDVSFTKDIPYVDLTGASGKEVLWAWAERDPYTGQEPYLTQRLKVIRNADAASGWFVQISGGLAYQYNQTLEVTYGHRYDLSTWTSSTDLETDVGMTEGMVATVIYGATHRVLVREEAQRNQLMSTVQPRRAEEVQPGVMMEVSREWNRLFEAGVARESSRLRREYPIHEMS